MFDWVLNTSQCRIFILSSILYSLSAFPTFGRLIRILTLRNQKPESSTLICTANVADLCKSYPLPPGVQYKGHTYLNKWPLWSFSENQVLNDLNKSRHYYEMDNVFCAVKVANKQHQIYRNCVILKLFSVRKDSERKWSIDL